MMKNLFDGFQISEEALTGIPEDFFRTLLPSIQNLELLKLSLYMLWKANTIGDYGTPFMINNLLLDKIFLEGFSVDDTNMTIFLADLLEKATENKILVRSKNKSSGTDSTYFINCEAGRRALSESRNDKKGSNTTLDQIQPNIFKIYEENIGPLTPIIADALRDAESRYPIQWIKEAIEIAIENNVRRWRYVESILDRWQKEGRDGTDRKGDQANYRRYIKD